MIAQALATARADTYPGPRTLAAEAAVKAAHSKVIDTAVSVADAFDRVLGDRRSAMPTKLRDTLINLVAAFNAESVAYRELRQASNAEWEAFSNPEPQEAQP